MGARGGHREGVGKGTVCIHFASSKIISYIKKFSNNIILKKVIIHNTKIYYYLANHIMIYLVPLYCILFIF